MSGARSNEPGSREPSPTVSALSGFDPSRKKDVFQVQLDAIRRATAFDAASRAAKALQWLHQYGHGVFAGGDYGTEFGDFAAAKPYVAAAHEAHAKALHDWAVDRVLADLERSYASAIEAATAGETPSGSTEGESAVAKPDAQTPSSSSAPHPTDGSKAE